MARMGAEVRRLGRDRVETSGGAGKMEGRSSGLLMGVGGGDDNRLFDGAFCRHLAPEGFLREENV